MQLDKVLTCSDLCGSEEVETGQKGEEQDDHSSCYSHVAITFSYGHLYDYERVTVYFREYSISYIPSSVRVRQLFQRGPRAGAEPFLNHTSDHYTCSDVYSGMQ